jgi:RNA polymerase-binding transcription factor
MNKTELKPFNKALTTLQIELRNGSANRDALTIAASADELDRIQDAGDRDWAMGNLERSSSRLREVDGALDRIAAGTFGTCRDCEESIGAKRLTAVPWASFCIVCQERADREQSNQVGEADADSEMAA